MKKSQVVGSKRIWDRSREGRTKEGEKEKYLWQKKPQKEGRKGRRSSKKGRHDKRRIEEDKEERDKERNNQRGCYDNKRREFMT